MNSFVHQEHASTASMNSSIQFSYLLFVLLGLGINQSNLSSQQEGSALRKLSDMLSTAAEETMKHCEGKAVFLEIIPAQSSSRVVQKFSEAFLKKDILVYRASTPEARHHILIDVRDLKNNSTVLNDTLVIRDVRMDIGVTIDNNENKMITWSHEFVESVTDTLRGKDAAAFHRDDREDAVNFFESVAEPILITIIATVIVILFFTVRGS